MTPDPSSPFAGLVDASGAPLPPSSPPGTAGAAPPPADAPDMPAATPIPAFDLYGRHLQTGDQVVLPAGAMPIYQILDAVPSFDPRMKPNTVVITLQAQLQLLVTPDRTTLNVLRVTGVAELEALHGRR